MIEPPTIVRVEASEIEMASEVLTDAFQDDSIFCDIFPETDERKHSLQQIWRSVLRYCTTFGEVYATRDMRGVASWLSPGNTELTPSRMQQTGMCLEHAIAKLSPSAQERLIRLFSFTDNLHKRVIQKPHWYLWLIGVKQDCQGQRVGSTLIEPVLVLADSQVTSCYLESGDERNLKFYNRHGFEVVYEGVVPGESFRIWGLVREPR